MIILFLNGKDLNDARKVCKVEIEKVEPDSVTLTFDRPINEFGTAQAVAAVCRAANKKLEGYSVQGGSQGTSIDLFFLTPKRV